MMHGIIKPCYSGCHETPGTWRQDGLEDEVVDISVVVDYLEKTFGYQVDLIVGHSRASIVAFRWLCTTEAGKKVSGFVNISGRYRMHVSFYLETLYSSLLRLSFLFRKFTVKATRPPPLYHVVNFRPDIQKPV